MKVLEDAQLILKLKGYLNSYFNSD